MRNKIRELQRIFTATIAVLRQQGGRALATQLIEKARRREFVVLGDFVPRDDFQKWVTKNEPDEEALSEQVAESHRMQRKPVISLLTPVWNPRPEILEATIRSVLAQTYDQWELCVVDGGSDEEIRQLLREFEKADSRIRVKLLESNLGISGNTNIALDMAKGDYVGFLDQDDTLAPFALFELVKCIHGSPDADLIYSDMDRIDANGARFNPLFKPEWSPEIMLSANYVVHFRVVRGSLLRALGGLRPGLKGAEDWDLIFRLSERTTHVQRIPKILYHWRLSPISAATAGFRIKPAIGAQLRAISDFMARNKMAGNVQYERSGSFRIIWETYQLPFTSIVVYSPEIDSALERCVQSVSEQSRFKKYEIIVVTPSGDELKHGTRTRVVRTDKTDFASASNLGARSSTGQVLVFLDRHSQIVSRDWLEEIVGWAMQPSIGAVGCKLISSEQRRIIHGGVVVGLPGYLFEGARERSWTPLGQSEWYRDLTAVSGACLATRREIFEELGGFAETPESIPDIAYCLGSRRKNYRVLYTPFAKLILNNCNCHSSDTRSITDPTRRGDPYYNPNLSTDETIPTLKLTS
jgi:glycosyltransferase involved in cell wall biosynthesis